MTIERDDPRVEAPDLAYAWRVLSVTGLGMTVCFLNTSMLPVALPDMVDDLQASQVASSWFLLAFQLLVAVTMLPLGRVSDMLGRRWMYIGGMAVVGVSAAAITLVSDPGLIIAARAVQGVGAAAVIVNTTALLVDAFPPRLAPIGIGWNITIMSTAIAVGPVIGGLMTDTVGWRGVFAISVPLAIVGSLWSAATLRPGDPGLARSARSFDYTGAVCSALALGGLVLAVSNASARGWSDPLVLACVATAAAGVVSFIAVERRAAVPVLDFALLRLRFRACAYGSTALLNIGQSATPLIVSLYLQSAREFSAVTAGLYVTALAAGNVVTAGLAGRLATRVETRVIATAGIGVVLGAMVALAVVFAAGAAGAALVVVLFLLGVGNGLFVTPNAAAINIGTQPDQRGMANGFRVAIDQSALLVGSAVVLTLLTSGLPAAVKPDAIGGHLDELTTEQMSTFVDAFPVTVLVVCLGIVAAIAVSAIRGRAPVATPAEATP